ncbi:MAG: hypothetical protein K8S98_02235 [Planctomycetes bacterium]|nr:hypothetical protein [Planctomycetota bacterium]
MENLRFSAAFAAFSVLSLAACRSGETRNEVGSVEGTQYRACCASQCDSSCTKPCCTDYFANRSAPGEYRECCGKVCDASCPMACCTR